MSKTNIVPHQHKISKADRQKNNGHKATIVWFTGLSGSGKSTLASYVEELLFKDAVQTYILDGDNIRSGLNSDLSFSPEDRGENIRRIGEVAKLFVDAGVVVLTAFVSPYENNREFVRGLVGEGEFIEVFVDCPLEVCEERDPKGLYRKARSGEISNFTGVSAPFEPPQNPELTVNTAEEELTSLGENVYTYIQSRI
jgi:adenylylsulfate kinase